MITCTTRTNDYQANGGKVDASKSRLFDWSHAARQPAKGLQRNKVKCPAHALFIPIGA